MVPALALVLAGCGSTSPVSGPTAHSSPTPIATQPPTIPATIATSPTSSPSPTLGATAPTGAPTTTAPAGKTLDLSAQSFAAFTSPSGTIGCVMYDGPSVSCQVENAVWKVQKPSNCDGAYGDEASLSRNRAALACHTDTDFVGDAKTQPVLPSGTTAVFRGLQCASATTGVTCRNATGHGFTVARTSYRLF